MKKILFLLWIVVANVAWAQMPDPDFNDKAALMEAKHYLKKATFVEAPGNATYDLVYQRLNVKLDPAVSYISGEVVSRFRFLQENINKINFDLSSSLTVDSVYFEGKKMTFQHSADVIQLSMPEPTFTTRTYDVTIYYQGAPIQNGFGSFMASTHNNTPVLWTLSEPYGARDWFPCKESLSDKIDSLDVIITCPSQYKAASNGKLMSDQVSGASRTAHWKHRHPIATYLVGVAVTDYQTFADLVQAPDGKQIEILNYVYPEYLTTAKAQSADIMRIMDFYNRHLITYPFADEKYGHAQFGWGGGMEHQTMSFMTNLGFELVAHEMAHQWFGDYITLASWHDIWLNEGFATYMTGLVYENINVQSWPAWKKYQLDRITSNPAGSVYVTDTTSINVLFNGRLSYSKGGYLLHMLRWEMGDEHFFQALKSYLTDPAITHGFAHQEDLVRHMEQAADTSFTEFFKDWYYGEGYPVYEIRQLAVLGSEGGLAIKVSQIPTHSSVGFFEMHIPIRVWKGGKSTDLRLFNTEQSQRFVVSESAVDSIQFDPDKWLIAKASLIVDSKELTTGERIKIISEPSANRIRVILPQYKGEVQVRIIDLSGKTTMTVLLGSKDSYLDVSGLKNGMYIVEVIAGKESKREKIVVGK